MNQVIIYYSVSGHTKAAAAAIHSFTGADIKEIELIKPYSFVGSVTRGLVDTYRKKIPEIKSEFDLSSYDVIYLGGPTWGYDVNPIIKGFLQEYDLSGKTVIPFCTDQGAPGKYFEQFSLLCNAAQIDKGHEFIYPKRKSANELNLEAAHWLKTLGSRE